MPQGVEQERHRAVHGDQFADPDPAVECEPGPVPDHRDQQQPRQDDLDGGDQGPHAGTAHGGPADVLGRAPVAAEEEFLAADAAQDAQARDGVGGQFGGPARLVALFVGAAGRGRQQRQYGEGQYGYADGHHHAQHGLVDHQRHADADGGERRGTEPGDGLDEPADLLQVTGAHGDDLTGGDPPGHGGPQLRRLTGQQLLEAGHRRDPVGDRGAVQHHVTDRHQRTEQQQQSAREQQPGAGTVHDGLHRDTHRDGEGGHPTGVHQAPAQRLGLAAELLPVQPPEQVAPGTDVRDSWIGMRKIANVHDVQSSVRMATFRDRTWPGVEREAR